MKTAALCLLFCASLGAQTANLNFAIEDPTGAKPESTLGSAYQFASTPVGGVNSLVLRIRNYGTNVVSLKQVFVSLNTTSAVLNSNFTITGLAYNKTLTVSGGNFEDITLNFAPLAVGATVGYLQASYTVEQNGCDITGANASLACPSTVSTVSTLQGTGAAPQIVLTYNTSSGQVALQSNSSTPLNFGNVSTSGSAALTFNLTNKSSAALPTPAVSLQSQLYVSTAFKLDTTGLPPTLAAGQTAFFTITFAPGQTGLTSATLVVGANSYPIQGTGVVLADIDALQISYVDATGVRTLPQTATPISFGQLTAGTTTSSTLTFTVTNPTTSFNAITVSALAATGVGFAITGAPNLPASIQPGGSIAFKVVFSGGATGTYTGTLAIGSRVFSLTGQSVSLNLPSVTLKLDQPTLTSQQQVHLTVQFATPSQITAIGTLAMQFTPSVANVSDDAAVMFLANSGRQLQVNVAAGATTATYNDQSALTFQTGTTAGTLTFTLTFPYLAPVTQSFTVSPQTVQITLGQALRQAPNLVLTLNGYDNTYSVGQLSFMFYDTAGKVLTPSAIGLDETSAFHQYFFTSNQAGGAFALQAQFPVTGDVTQVGSVAVTLTNSAGAITTTQTFQ